MTERRDDHDQRLQAMKADLFDLVSEEPRPGVESQARKWVTAYEAFTDLLERNLQNQLGVANDLPGRRRMERANIALLEGELETIRGRLDHWRRQLHHSRESAEARAPGASL